MEMERIQRRIKKWIESVQSGNLQDIAREMKETITWKPDASLNMMIFKLFLHLCHAAERCDNTQIKTGKELTNLTNTIASTLSDVPDLHKFYCSLYHIIRRLLAMELYKEAEAVSNWLVPGKLLRNASIEYPDMYLKVGDLWRIAGNQFLKKSPDPFDYQSSQNLFTIIKCELHTVQIASKQYTKSWLGRIIFWLSKVATLDSKLQQQGDLNFRSAIMKDLEQAEISLEGKDKFDIYRLILIYINNTVVSEITTERMEFAAKALSTVYTIFERSVRSDTECFRCLLLYKKLCLMLLKPMGTLSEDLAQGIQQYMMELENVVKEFGGCNAIKWNACTIVNVLEPLFNYWESGLKTGQAMFLTFDVLREIIRLVQFLSSIISAQNVTCKLCHAVQCTVKTDLYTATVLRIKCFGILSRMPMKESFEAVFPLIQNLLEDCISSIWELKESGCRQWSNLWSSCGIHIWNIGVNWHKALYEETAYVFSLLCSCIVRFEGIRATTSHLAISHPFPSTLQKLSLVHFTHGKYREAMTASALNGLMSYGNPGSKAFRMWANIKHKCVASKNVMQMTMLDCLSADRDVIREIGVDINLSDYDVKELCLQELKGLQESRCNMRVAMQASLNQLESLDPDTSQFVQGVLLLGHHSLHHEYNEEFALYLQKAATKLKRDKDASISHLCLEANLKFFAFVAHLQKMETKTQMEMESAKIALRAPKLTSDGPQDADNVVPSYSMINIEQDAYLYSTLSQALKKWNICIETNITEIIEGWQPSLTLHALMIAGEYSRLHRFPTCESHAWMLAYKLARKLGDHCACIHVVGRSISLREINNKWIDAANELVVELRNSKDCGTVDTIAMFWLSLADFYFETGKYVEATKLFEQAVSLPEICPEKNVSTYLLSLDTMLQNYKLHSNDIQDKDYAVYIVRCLYTMIHLKESLDMRYWASKEKQLYSCDILLTTTTNISLRMNSLLSYKEISSHLIQRLKIAQKLGATLRVAECLKCLCFIDLSRLQLDDCEVKLQGLEQILKIESFKESRNAKLRIVPNALSPVTPPNRVVDPVRDVRQNDASPVLRKKVFVKPDFLLHDDCSCYKCKNLSYQYIVFASTHIRAQLYALQGHRQQALEHFRGGFSIKGRLFQMECKLPLKDIPENGTNLMVHPPWQRYYNTVDYVSFLLDFSRFVKKFNSADEEEVLNIAQEALMICEAFNLTGHPIYMSVYEFVLDCQFQTIFQGKDSKKFTVPDPDKIDISKYESRHVPAEPSTCVTPTAGLHRKKPLTIRRNKTPPLLKLTKVSMDLSDDEESGVTSKPTTPRPKASRVKTIRPVRRKILEEEYKSSSPMPSSSTHVLPVVSALDLPEPMENCSARFSLGQIIDEAASLIPDISQRLRKVGRGERLEEPASSEKIGEVVKMLEDFRMNRGKDTESRRTQQRRKTKAKSQRALVEVKSSSTFEEDEGRIGDMIDLFKGMTMEKRPRSGRISNLMAESQISLPATDLASRVEDAFGIGKLSITDDIIEHRPSTSKSGGRAKTSSKSSESKVDPACNLKPAIQTYSRRRKQSQVTIPSIGVEKTESMPQNNSSLGSAATDSRKKNQNLPEIKIADETKGETKDKMYEMGKCVKSRPRKTESQPPKVAASDTNIQEEQQISADAPRTSRFRKKLSSIDSTGESDSVTDIGQKRNTARSGLRSKNLPQQTSRRPARSAKAIIVYSDSEDEDPATLAKALQSDQQTGSAKYEKSRTSGNAENSSASVSKHNDLDDSDIVLPSDAEEGRTSRFRLGKVVSKKTSRQSKPKKKES